MFDIMLANKLGKEVMDERLRQLELDRAFAHAETTHPAADFFTSMSGNLVTALRRRSYRPTIAQVNFGAPKLATETGTYHIVR